MSDQQFKVGDRVRWGGTLPGTVLAVSGDAVWVKWDDRGDLCTVDAADLRLIAKRYVVELRAPKAGEGYAYYDTIRTSESDFNGNEERFVIVDEVEQ